MKTRILVAIGLTLISLHAPSLPAQTNTASEDPKLAAEEDAECRRNLRIIYDAIQNYRADHKDLPNWLSDLVPQYITNVNVLTCPVCKRTGVIESPPLADPRLPCSYLYGFCAVPLVLPNGVRETRREWKRRQMGLAGSVVPIVRCRRHRRVLNLASDGKPLPDVRVAWHGVNRKGSVIGLFATTWTNVVREVKIESVDFVSAMGGAAPFLIAIAADQP